MLKNAIQNMKGAIIMYKNNELNLKVMLQVGDKIKINCPQFPEHDGKVATLLEQIDDYTFKVDISDVPFNETLFDGGTLIR